MPVTFKEANVAPIGKEVMTRLKEIRDKGERVTIESVHFGKLESLTGVLTEVDAFNELCIKVGSIGIAFPFIDRFSAIRKISSEYGELIYNNSEKIRIPEGQTEAKAPSFFKLLIKPRKSKRPAPNDVRALRLDSFGSEVTIYLEKREIIAEENFSKALRRTA